MNKVLLALFCASTSDKSKLNVGKYLNNKLFTVILAIIISTIMIMIPSDVFAVMFTGSQTAAGEWEYTLTYNADDNYSICQPSTTITLTGLVGVTSASGPTSTDFVPTGGFLDLINLAWTAGVLNGGTKVVWTHVGSGTGNFPVDKHVFGFKVFADAIDGTVNVATDGFAFDVSTHLADCPADRDIVATTSGPAALPVGGKIIPINTIALLVAGFSNQAVLLLTLTVMVAGTFAILKFKVGRKRS